MWRSNPISGLFHISVPVTRGLTGRLICTRTPGGLGQVAHIGQHQRYDIFAIERFQQVSSNP